MNLMRTRRVAATRSCFVCWLALACAAPASHVSAQDDDLNLDDDEDTSSIAAPPAVPENVNTAPVPAPAPAAETQSKPVEAAGAAATPDPAAIEEARSHFQRGVDYYSEGDFRAALIEFERAYAIQPTFRLLYNLGQVAYELRDYAGAERYFSRYLVEGEDELSAERTGEVKRELERLRTRVASVELRASLPGATIRVDDHVVPVPESGPIRLSAGRRRVIAEKSGYAPVRKVVDVVGGETLSVDLQFGPALTGAGGQRADSGGVGPWPWVLGITTGLAAIGGAGFAYAAYRDSAAYDDQLKRYTTHSELERLSSQTQTKAFIADVLFGTAAVGAVVTVVLIVAGGGSEKPKPAPSSGATARVKWMPSAVGVTF